MIHFSLFSGIGGFDLASEWMGWNNYLSCELADFPNKVLKYYWPKAYHHRDIKTLNYDTIQDELTRRFGEWRTEPIILTGGFPCQPYSLAGQRKGKEDERHLWPEMLRLIHEIKPDFIVGENVFGLLNWNGGMVFDEVLTDLGNAGYEVTPLVIPAAAVNAPHGRDRIWFVANSNNFGSTTRRTEIQKENGEIPQRHDNTKFSNTDKPNATNTDELRLQQCKDTRKMGRGPKEIRGERDKSTNGPKTNGKISHATDTNCWGTQARKNREVLGKSNTEEQARGFVNDGIQRDVTDTKSTGSERECVKGQREIQSDGRNSRTIPANFEEFPTQPPICGGDDGLPTQLDGVTFSKWRNESIKGYGNAIVPQVAYEIFKAIELAYSEITK